MTSSPSRQLQIYLPLVAAIAVGAILFAARVRLIDGAFLNSYPFISEDGFDWMFQGVALWLHVTGVDSAPWPILRAPGFGVVTAVDYALRADGLLALAVQSLGVGATVWSVGRIAQQFDKPPIVIVAGLAALIATPLFEINLFMLSDQLCMGLMMLSVERFIAAERHARRSALIVAAVMAVLAGVTQSYGIIAFCGLCGAFAAMDLVWARKLRFDLAIAAVLVAVATFGLLKLWRSTIPHAAGMNQFDYLKLSADMLGFYLNVWTICFLPLAPALLAGVTMWRERSPFAHRVGVALGGVIACFMALTFFYQYPESRLTFFYQPLVVAALLVIAPHDGRWSRVAVTGFWVAAVLGIVLTWGSAWQPKLARPSLRPLQTWPGQLVRARPLDRFDLTARCGQPVRFCAALDFPVRVGGVLSYRNEIMREYVRRTLKAAQPAS